MTLSQGEEESGQEGGGGDGGGGEGGGGEVPGGAPGSGDQEEGARAQIQGGTHAPSSTTTSLCIYSEQPIRNSLTFKPGAPKKL